MTFETSHHNNMIWVRLPGVVCELDPADAYTLCQNLRRSLDHFEYGYDEGEIS